MWDSVYSCQCFFDMIKKELNLFQTESAKISIEYLNGQALCTTIATMIRDCQTKSFGDCITDDYKLVAQLCFTLR